MNEVLVGMARGMSCLTAAQPRISEVFLKSNRSSENTAVPVE